MKLLTIVGARPQIIKASVISRAIREENKRGSGVFIEEVMVHTGQHSDKNMSGLFFEELSIPEPKYNLGIAGLAHGAMTGRMLEEIEKVLLKEKPDRTLVYGDTNSALAGALAAVKLHVPVAHVEAGLRSFDRRMPEEINRALTDHISDLLFCPTDRAVDNLKNEGITEGVHKVGDVMYDASLFYREIAIEKSRILDKLGLTKGGYALATIHRAENTDDKKRLASILKGLSQVAAKMPVVFPVHPRTSKALSANGLADALGKIKTVHPVSYLDMIRLEMEAKVIITDSGGVQKEAYFYHVPCVTVRDETEWVETVKSGWNRLTGCEANSIISAVDTALETKGCETFDFYGDGHAANKILEAIIT